MRLRLTKIDEYQFLTCVKNSVWGSNSSRFKDWQIGDYLVIIVEKQIAGLAEVSGTWYRSDKVVWDNGLFPYRIPIKFNRIFDKDNRPNLLGTIRDTLISIWSPMYGWGILNQVLLTEPQSKIILQEINSHTSHMKEMLANLETLIDDAKVERDRKAIRQVKGKRGRPRKEQQIVIKSISKEPQPIDVESISPHEESLHSKAQYILASIGQITGCKIHIASNDRKRRYQDKELATMTLPTMPNLGLSKDASDRISRIDVIWLNKNAAVCAFEVETSTSIFSGLLRMSDLLAEIPNLNIKLYVVAQKERGNKVLSELFRPTFRKIGLNENCEFISIEDLELLLGRIENLAGHVQPSILDTVSQGLEEES